MPKDAENVVQMDTYEYQTKVYERQRKIYEDQMLLWETFNKTSSEMDARFDKTLFAVAAGSFGLSFAFIDTIISLASANCPGVLVASWACFAVCLIVIVLGHLLSAKAYSKQRDNVARNMALQFADKPAEDKITRDFVSPCNYIALFAYIGGIICLLTFVALNL
ncbi:MAG: hypothetical protein LBU00_06010 [Treponema sp.]|jgi:hypothetical protein|nr:hypothetical protein [Treponema sp.]